DEPPRVVIRQRRRLSCPSAQRTRQQIGLNQNLKSIADSNDRLAAIDEFPHRLTKVMNDLVRQDLPRGNVIAVTETSGKREYLELVEDCRVFQHPVDMKRLRCRTRQLERKRC